MLAEVYERVETETGGILLGHRDGDTWYVLESVEPGPKSIFKPTYFEYDDDYVTYRANKLSRLYKCSVELLGLWHRHPSLMKTFSSTDDGTNKIYSDMLRGAISGIVTLGNGFEITMYYVPPNLHYEKIEWVIDDEQIPQDFLSYYDMEYYKDLINETAKKIYGSRYRIGMSSSVYQKSNLQIPNLTNVDRSYIPEDRPVKRGILASIVEKIADTINDMFEGADEEEYSDEEYDTTAQEESDIAYIFDAIEPEIAYLQQLEAKGKMRSTIGQKKDRNGKDGLILNIMDLRQREQYVYRVIFFVNNNRIMVKDEDGNVRPYTDNLIALILGGK